MKKIVIYVLTLLILLLPATALSAASTEESDSPKFPIELNDSSKDIVRIQDRLKSLGYINFRATGRFADMTYKGVIAFQSQNDLVADGIVSNNTYSTLFTNSVKRNKTNPNFTRISGPGLLATPTKYGEKSSWDEINSLFKVGDKVTVTDFNSGKKFEVIRTGGDNHAHVVPATQSDYNTFLKCFGGEYTWEKRAMLVEIGGTLYAASLFGMPNADKTDVSFMDGSLCLFFNGSTSDIASIPDAEHNSNIEKAAGSN